MAVEKPQYPGTMSMSDAFQWPDSVPRVPWEELTEEQRRLVMEAYRFSGYKPGMYQGVTFAGPDLNSL